MQRVLELFRSTAADDPFAFNFGSQEYVLRTESGAAETARLRWDDALLSLLEAVRRPGRDRELVQQLGDRLLRFLSQTSWAESESQLAEALQRGERVVITLRLAAAELFALPWELLTLKGSGQHLGELPSVLLRYAWPGTSTAPGPPQPPAEGGRILLGWSAAAGAVPAAEHESAIAEACALGHLPFRPETDVLPHLTPGKLSSALGAADSDGRGPVAILHLLCHGVRSGQGFALGLSSDDGRGLMPVDAGQLRQLLAPHAQTLRLVVLCACDSANAGELGSHLGSVAQTLHRAGLQAVVASRFPLSIAGSVALARGLYRALLAGPASLESAFLAARSSLLHESRSLDWASVQLYARPEDGDDTRPIAFRPYRGLLAFQPEHGRFFYGRDAEQAEILANLSALRAAGKPRFLVVAGASGTGKSSVILGGVVPALVGEAGRAAQDDGIRRAITHLTAALDAHTAPEVRQLLTSLQQQLTRLSAQSGAWEVAVLRPGSHPLAALHDALSRRQHPGQPFLLVVDQFEEIFTHVQDASVRREFAARLWAQAQAQDGPSCILTLRVDFLAQCGDLTLDESGLRLDRIAYDQAHRVFIAQMSPQALRSAIEKPAARVGLALPEGLAFQMLAEVGNEPGALPLLSYVLDLLWQKRQERAISAESYTALGGVAGALQGMADAAIDRLTPDGQRLARQLLTRLVGFGESGEAGMRRRVVLHELRLRVGGSDPALFDAVVAAFVEARLLVHSEEAGKITLEVAHEALIRKWARLRQWLREDRERLSETAELDGWHAEWRTHGTLLSGPRLGYATRVLQKYPAELGPELAAFIRRSQRSERRRRLLRGALLCGAMAVLTGLTLFARTQARQAQRQARVAQSRSLSLQARPLLDGKIGHALLLSALSHRLHRDAESRGILYAALERSRPLRRFLHGPAGLVSTLLSSAGTIVAAGADGHLWNFDAETLDPAARPLYPGAERENLGEIVALAEGAQGRLLAAATRRGRIVVIDTGARQRLHELKLQGSGPVGSVDISPDGRLLAAGGQGGSIELFELSSGKRLFTLTGHEHEVLALRFAPAAALLASGGADSRIILWDLDTHQPLGEPLRGHGDYVASLAFHPSGSLLASGGADRAIFLWDVARREAVAGPLRKHSAPLAAVAFSADGRFLFSGGWEGAIQVWDAISRKPIGRPLLGHVGKVVSLSPSGDGRTLVSGGDGELVVWDLRAHDALHGQLAGPLRTAAGSVDITGDGRLIVAGGGDGRLTLLDVDSEELAGPPLPGHHDAINAVAISPDGRLVATASSDRTVGLWELRSRRRLALLSGAHQRSVQAVSWSADGKLLASGDTDGKVALWDVERRALADPLERAVLSGKQGAIGGLAFRPGTGQLAAAGLDGRILLWDAATGKPMCAPLTGHAGSVSGVRFSPDGQLLASAGSEGRVLLWRGSPCPAPDPEPLHERASGATALSFSGNGSLLAIGGQDGQILLADLALGRLVGLPLAVHSGPVVSLAFSQAGTLASSDEQVLWLWTLSEGSAESKACSRAGANLSHADWQRYLGELSYCRICAAWPAGEGAAADAPVCTGGTS